MKLYNIHRENKYDKELKIGNKIKFDRCHYNYLKESLFDISSSFTQVEKLEDGKDIKKYINFSEVLNYTDFKDYPRKNQIQLLDMIREYIVLSSSYNRESLLEEVRRKRYPNRPSRFECMFLTDEEGLENWLEILKKDNLRFYYEKENPIEVFEVEAKGNIFITTSKLIPNINTKLSNMYFEADRYWNPTEYDLCHSNCKEYLLEGTAKILRKVK